MDPSKCNTQLVQELLCSSTRRNNAEGVGTTVGTAYIFVNGSRGERGDGSIGGVG